MGCIFPFVPSLMPIILCFVAQTATAPATQAVEPVRRATAMFALVVLSLGVLLLAVVLMVVAKRVRRRRLSAPNKPAGVLVDPWSESARRVKPFDSTDRSE